MQPGGRLVPVFPKLHPPVVDHGRMGAGRVEVNAEVDTAQQLPVVDTACPAHPTSIHRDSERDRLAREPLEQGGIHMEARSRGGGVRGR